MSVSIHYQWMGNTRSWHHRALDTRLHASALNRKTDFMQYEYENREVTDAKQ